MIFKWIKFYFYWILLYFSESDKKHLQTMAEIKGFKCLGYKDDAFGRTYIYDPNQPPQKEEFITFKKYYDTCKPTNEKEVEKKELSEVDKLCKLLDAEREIRLIKSNIVCSLYKVWLNGNEKERLIVRKVIDDLDKGILNSYKDTTEAIKTKSYL